MAEARNAIDLYYLQKRGFQIAGVEDGYYTVSVSVPYPRTIVQLTGSRIKRIGKYIQNRVWPASLRTVLFVMSGVSVVTLKANRESWVRSGWLADLLWKADAGVNSINPFHKYIAVEVRVAYLASTAAFVGMLGIVAMERLILGLLLHYKGWLYLKPKEKVPIGVKIWGGLVKMFSGNINLTYGFSLSLPCLPLPSLKQTTDKYLESIEPLLTPEQFEETKKLTKEFVNKQGVKLQRYLFLKWLFSSNYVAEWWEKYVYLRSRTPICVNSNYYIMDSKFRPSIQQSERAANLVHHFLRFKDLIEKEKLEPLMIRDSIPLCMEQYERMFGTCRVPGREFDSLKHMVSRHIVVIYKGQYFQLEVYHGARGTELVPYSREEIKYQLDLIISYVNNDIKTRTTSFDDNTVDTTNSQIKPNYEQQRQTLQGQKSRAFIEAGNTYRKSKIQSYSDLVVLNSQREQNILSSSSSDNSNKKETYSLTKLQYLGPGVAALTTLPRANWAEVREIYFSEGANRVSLLSIEKAAFILVLDDKVQTDLRSRAKSLFHGDGFNRYFDKSLNLIVFKDGYAGLNTEHSWADAPAVAHLWEFALLSELKDYSKRIKTEKDNSLTTRKSILNLEEEEENKIKLDFSKIIKPKVLIFDIEEELERIINQAGVVAKSLISDVDLEVIEFNKFGAGFMKKSGLSPDAFIQVALQLTYYRDRKRFDLTYESSMTRLFRKGRTETVRSLSKETVSFVLAMENNKHLYSSSELNSISEEKNKSREQVLELLYKATEKHNFISKEAMCGKGIDRHLFALYITSRGFEVDSEFLNEALSIPWRLSTSQQTQTQTRLRDSLSAEIAKKFLSPGGGFGAVSNDGYGVSYMIVGNDMIFFHVSSVVSNKDTNSKRFIDLLEKSLGDMKKLIIG